MSVAGQLLARLRRASCNLTANTDGTLSFTGGELTPELRAEIAAVKPALHWILAWERITKWRDAGLSIDAENGSLSVGCVGGWYKELHVQCVADLAGHSETIVAVLAAEMRPVNVRPGPPRPPRPPKPARKPTARPPRSDRPIEVAVPWLRNLLAAGPIPARDVRRLSAAAGLSWRTLQRAQLRVGGESVKREFGGCCTWRLVVVPPGCCVA